MPTPLPSLEERFYRPPSLPILCTLPYRWLSLRLVPNTASGLVHICIPHNGATVRSRTLSARTYSLSWAPHLWVALLPSLCFYYSTELSICQELFFVKSYIFPRRYLTRTSSKGISGFEPPSIAVARFIKRIRTATARSQSRIPFVPLLYHTLRDLSRSFLASVDFTSSNYELERGWLLQVRVSILLHPTTNRGEVGYCISS